MRSLKAPRGGSPNARLTAAKFTSLLASDRSSQMPYDRAVDELDNLGKEFMITSDRIGSYPSIILEDLSACIWMAKSRFWKRQAGISLCLCC
jgi:hypothetical protein